MGRQHLLSKSCFYLKNWTAAEVHLQRWWSFLCRRTKLCFGAWTSKSPTWPSVVSDTAEFIHLTLASHNYWKKGKELHTIVSFLFCRKPSKRILVSLTAMLVLGVHVYVYLYLCVWLPAHARIICSLLYSSGSQKSPRSWTSGSYFQSLRPHVCCKGHLLQMFKNSFPVLYVF